MTSQRFGERRPNGSQTVAPAPAPATAPGSPEDPAASDAAGSGRTDGLRRDATTWAAYAALITFGWLIYSLGPILPLLREEQGTSRTVAAVHSLCFAAGNIVAGASSARISRRFGRATTVRSGALLMLLGVALLIGGSLPSGGLLGLTLTAVFGAGVGGGLTINASLSVLADHHKNRSAAAVSEGNAFAAVVGLLAPLAIGAAIWVGLTWRAGIGLIAILGTTLFTLVGRLRSQPSYGRPTVTRTSASRSALPSAFWLLWITLIACAMIETSLTTWSPELLTGRTSMSAGAATASVSMVLAGMALGRFVIGWLSLRRDVRLLFVASLCLAAVGWLLLYLASTPMMALIALLVVGMGIAGHFPLGVVLLTRAAEGQPDRAVGLLGIGLGTASGVGPFLLGGLADQFGIRTAFLLVPTALLVAAIGVRAADRWPGRVRSTS